MQKTDVNFSAAFKYSLISKKVRWMMLSIKDTWYSIQTLSQAVHKHYINRECLSYDNVP